MRVENLVNAMKRSPRDTRDGKRPSGEGHGLSNDLPIAVKTALPETSTQYDNGDALIAICEPCPRIIGSSATSKKLGVTACPHTRSGSPRRSWRPEPIRNTQQRLKTTVPDHGYRYRAATGIGCSSFHLAA